MHETDTLIQKVEAFTS